MKSIIFNQHQVNHALKNKEGMFRVVVKPQPIQPAGFPDAYFDCYNKGHQWNWWTKNHKQLLGQIIKSKFKVGETIFVKEAFLQKLGSTQLPSGEHETFFTGSKVEYVADGAEERWVNPDAYYSDYWKKRPAHHMKQEHSRLTLRIKSVKVERLQDISEGDAKAEGAKKIGFDADYGTFHVSSRGDYRTGFIGNWISTHKKPEEKWEANPFCFVYEYEVVR